MTHRHYVRAWTERETNGATVSTQLLAIVTAGSIANSVGG